MLDDMDRREFIKAMTSGVAIVSLPLALPLEGCRCEAVNDSHVWGQTALVPSEMRLTLNARCIIIPQARVDRDNAAKRKRFGAWV